MAPANIIAPLTNSQKLFLQRLLVAHVLTDDNAKQLYQSIKEGFADVAPSQEEEEEEEGGGRDNGDQGYMGNNFEHCLGIINASLVPAFNLEVGTVSLPPPYNADNDDEPSSAQKSPGGRKRAHLVKYHAIVNRSNDGIAQSHAFPLSKGGPHEMAYFRLALEKMVERGIELFEEESSSTDAGVGCPGTLNRMELINLRTEMEGNHKDKLTIRQTECALEVMEVEGWVVRVAPPAEDDSNDDEEEEEEEDGDDEEAVGRPKRRRKKRGTPSSGGSRRKSLKGTFYGIGPRSFMELGDFLQKAGLPGDRMPQSILHAL
mmetsp:Transcript_30476/g.55307  ORF Transcript_30476/g.55307 Transcript_30476/m.55307 type:complete len:317 (+) Transcript_30476:158-1108(+)